MRTDAGFTLIEMIVAVSILALVAVLGWRGLDGIVRGRTALAEESEQVRGMQLTFAQMERDCAQLAPPVLIGTRPPLLAIDDRLVMIRLVLGEQQASRLQVVTYRLLNGTLTRQESPATRDLVELDELMQIAAGNDPESSGNRLPPVILQNRIAAMQIRLWDASSRTWVKPEDNVSGNAVSWTGLEMALQLPGQQGRVVKLFSLGVA